MTIIVGLIGDQPFSFGEGKKFGECYLEVDNLKLLTSKIPSSFRFQAKERYSRCMKIEKYQKIGYCRFLFFGLRSLDSSKKRVISLCQSMVSYNQFKVDNYN